MGYDHTLSGGHPVLDFVNSLDDWTVADAEDYLATLDDALGLGVATGLIARGETGRVERASAELASLAALKRLRASLERILRAFLDERKAPAEDVRVLERGLIEAAQRTELRQDKNGLLSRRVAAESNGASLLRLRIVDEAVALLSSGAIRHVKACPTCGWFFLDVSKNQSRVWCSMDTCGARAKARRYYRRTKRRRARA
jgi:predicted RNA-binding Zn ribbon-like protein